MFAKSNFILLAMTACLNVCFANAVFAQQKQINSLPFLPGLPDQKLMIAPSKELSAKTKTYILPATPATTQFGFFDNGQAPVLTIHSGDSVAVETMAASVNQVVYLVLPSIR